MITDPYIPAGWLVALNAVKLAAPEAILAGGALRDLENGAPVKDLDIFVEHSLALGVPSTAGVLASLSQFDPFGTSRTAVCDFSSCEMDADCILSETLRFRGMDVNIVHLDGAISMDRVLSRIDFGICQIGTDGASVTRTPAYLKDRAERTFTITRRDSEGDLNRTLRRWERLSQKYPGWTLVNPWAAA